jgi:hypothetical protein
MKQTIILFSSLFCLGVTMQAQITNPKLTPVSKKTDTAKLSSLLVRPTNTIRGNTVKTGAAQTTTGTNQTTNTPPPSTPPSTLPPTSSMPPPTTVFVPSPQLIQSFNWWKEICPSEFGINYLNPPTTQSFYDSAIKIYNQKTVISFDGLRFSPGLPKLQPDSLFHLRALPNLNAVYLSFNTCENTTFQQLSMLPNLKAVIMSLNAVVSLPFSFSFNVNNQSIITLLQNRRLENIQLAKCKLVTDVAFAGLRNQTNLKKLTIYNMDGLTNQVLLSLEGCTSLEEIDIVASGNITMAGLNNLKSIMNTLPSLRTIAFRGNGVERDDFYAFITSCKSAGYNVGGVW